jgi:hypothetical protein
VFDDLAALRQLTPVPTRRARSTETFARIPHDRGDQLGRLKLSGAAWTLLIVLDRLIFEGRGRNPVTLPRRVRQAAGLSRHMTKRGLRDLEAAGVVVVDRRPGHASRVLHRWFPAS